MTLEEELNCLQRRLQETIDTGKVKERELRLLEYQLCLIESRYEKQLGIAPTNYLFG